jgi:hypothetical protein
VTELENVKVSSGRPEPAVDVHAGPHEPRAAHVDVDLGDDVAVVHGRD